MSDQQRIPGNPRTSTVVWVDVLTTASVLRLAKLSLKSRINTIVYLQATVCAGVCGAMLRWVGLLPSPTRCVYSLGEMRTSDGRSLRYAVEDDCLRLVDAVALERLGTGNIPSDLVETQLSHGKASLYFYKALAEKFYPAVLLTHVALSVSRRDHKERPTILLSDGLAATQIARLGLDVEYIGASPTPNLVGSLAWVVRLKTLLPLLVLVFAGAVRVFVPGRLTHQADKMAKVAVQFNDGVDPRFRSDLFWLPSSGIDPQHVLLYFNGGQCVPGPEVMAQLEHQGVDWVCLPGLSLHRLWHAMCVCRARPRILWQGMGTIAARIGHTISLSSESDSFKFWQGVQAIRLSESVDWWSRFFKRLHAIVHLHTQDTGSPMVAQSIAMDLVNGISVGYHWSHLFLLTATHAQDHTIYFSWGPYYDSFLKRPPSQITHLLYSGYLSCRSDPPSAEGAYRLRQALKARGADYVIGLLDSSFDDSIHISQEMYRTLHEAVLGLVARDPSLGLILKPKDNNNLSRLPALRSVVERLCSEGRCVVLDSKVMAAEVALAADIVVGLGLSSAVIEGALLAGKPGLHCDLSRKHDDRLYRWGYGRVVFDNTDRLLDAIDDHRRGRRRDIGDHTAILAEIDPYQDGAGASRIGKYLRWYWDSRAEGKTREAALAHANSRYKECWGMGENAALAPGRRAPVSERLLC